VLAFDLVGDLAADVAHELLRHPAPPEPGDDAAAAELVERGVPAGQHDRRVEQRVDGTVAFNDRRVDTSGLAPRTAADPSCELSATRAPYTKYGGYVTCALARMNFSEHGNRGESETSVPTTGTGSGKRVPGGNSEVVAAPVRSLRKGWAG
jgi:hypothetical protein